MTQKFYAGIGSRETPDHILKIMRYLGAHLYTQGWALRSGGAAGADTAFEEGHNDARRATNGENQKEIFLPWSGYQNNVSMLHPGAEPFTHNELDLAAMYHPNWKACSPAAQKMHARNVRIIRGLDTDQSPLVSMVICWTKNGITAGGTGQALRMADEAKIKIFNLGTAPNSAELERLIHEIGRFQVAF